MFDEKKTEYSVKQGKEIPVWQSPKYIESRQKAIDVIESHKYGIEYGDFWILMNETKSGKMAYTGLIISHNGCLKINDALPPELKFDPDCVFVNENGFGNSLVFSYSNKAQGLFEVGEVSAANCKIAYPYAMALKRLIDRVVLKNSKLAFSGIYGEDEADEFKQPIDEPTKPEKKPVEFSPPKTIYVCADCKDEIKDYTDKNGKVTTAEELATKSREAYGKQLCAKCAKEQGNNKG